MKILAALWALLWAVRWTQPQTKQEESSDDSTLSTLLYDNECDYMAKPEQREMDWSKVPPLYRPKQQGKTRLGWEQWNFPGEGSSAQAIEGWAGKVRDGSSGPWRTVHISGPSVRRFGHKR